MNKVLHKNIIGLLLLLITPLSLLGSIFVENKPFDWWYTISDTYYICPAFAVLFTAAAILILLYDFNTRLENIFKYIIGFSALGLVIFPCSNLYGLEKVGFFQLPDHVSSVLHTIFSVVMLLSVLVLFLFTAIKTSSKKTKIFLYAAVILISIGAILFLIGKLGLIPGYWKFFGEMLIIIPYAVKWVIIAK